MTRTARILPRLALCGLLAGVLVPASARADEAAEPPAPAAQAVDPEAARQARIEEYLRKKEEKRLQRERERAEKDAAKQAEAEERARLEVEEQAIAAQLQADTQAEEAQRLLEDEQLAAAGLAPEGRRKRLPDSLAKAQESVRHSALGQDPTVQAYLDLVDSQTASAHQLAALGNFLAEAGLRREAMTYYQAAVRMEKDDPVLWTNVGTLHRQMGDPEAAADAYGRALSIDANHAVAHYNLGAALDSMGQYDNALREYKIALTLDESLGDPAVNPQAANNPRLMAVKLLVYQERSGSAGLPLSKVPGGELPAQEGNE